MSVLRLPVDDALKLSDRFVSYPIGLLCAFEGEVECSRSAALARARPSRAAWLKVPAAGLACPREGTRSHRVAPARPIRI